MWQNWDRIECHKSVTSVTRRSFATVWAKRGIQVSASAKIRGFSAALHTMWDTWDRERNSIDKYLKVTWTNFYAVKYVNICNWWFKCWILWHTFEETSEEVTFPTVSTLSVTMSSFLEEEVISKVSLALNDLLELAKKWNILGEESANALAEVQLDAGRVMVRRV